MFATGDLLWIPQGSTLLSPNPNNPASFWKTKEPVVGLMVEASKVSSDWSLVIVNGQKWTINNKNIKHLRKKQ